MFPRQDFKAVNINCHLPTRMFSGIQEIRELQDELDRPRKVKFWFDENDSFGYFTEDMHSSRINLRDRNN